MKLADLKKTFSRLSKRDEKSAEIYNFSPVRNWAILVTLFFLLLTGVFITHFFLFNYFSEKSNLEGDLNVQAKAKLIDDRTLNETTENFSLKEKYFKNYLLNRPPIIDPAL